ncbi:autotransporter assembly complex family protein [Acidovorax sp. SRB_24]|uniref:autotransporter assembly complex protein TamA n=1 Tax=Acidovorax sp. SRB_24 TaxID=1962700 RepID=UPI00145E7CA2|nr:BamA/TamA family outer membrane protein [Acidovorax sp. SRB_24]NMM76630.1 outer membrane protein assembly factor [Acidovorax sp. SRB_24]
MIARPPPSTPARWPALLLFSVLGLAGCSLLPVSLGGPRDTAPDVAGVPDDVPLAFTLDVQAPRDIEAYLTKNLELQRFRRFPGLEARELSRLLGAADSNARELLATLGYFAPTLALDMQETPGAEAPRRIVLTVAPGPQTHIRSATIDVTGPAATSAEAAPQRARVQNEWALPPGQPFTQSDWDGAKDQGLRTLRARRYPTARIANSRAEVDADRHEADLAVNYDSGPAYRFGPLRVEGSERYDPDGARRLARLPTGAVYSEARLLDAQQRLASSGYYDAVFLTLDTDGTDPEAAPVTAQVREAKLQKWVFGVGVSTDSGPRLSVDHTHNRLPGIGWRALNKLQLDRKNKLLSTEWTALPADDGWRWFSGAQVQREATGSYEVNSARLRGGRTRSDDRIDRTAFLQYDYAHNQGPSAPPSSTAVTANYSWTGRYFNSPTTPTRGFGVAWELGAGTTLTPQRDPFVRAMARWLHFVPLGKVQLDSGLPRDSRLALRAEGGAVLARSGAQIPVTQLFLTGGDTTVRGYGYRTIGARKENDLLFGGRYLAVASVEWQRPFAVRGNVTDWESTVFADAGAVADRVGDLSPQVGVGAGVRWRSPVGPLQADLAYGLKAKSLRLHLRLGFTF